jgi:hypothetical protein
MGTPTKLKRVLLLTAMLAVAVAAPRTESVAGTVACESDADRGCRIVWNVSGVSARSVWLEELNPESSVWHRVAPLGRASGITDETVAGGRLYRTIACDEPTETNSCVPSTVFWAPFQAPNVEAIPAIVENKQGLKMYVSKSSPLSVQNLQYNVYLLERLMSGLDDATMRSMPPMTNPRLGPDVSPELFMKATKDERIQHHIYKMYDARRASKAATANSQ